MGWLTTIYVLVVVFTGLPAMFVSGLSLGVCGMVAPLLALGGGGGISQAIDGTAAAGKDAGSTLAFALAFAGLSLWWPSYIGWHLWVVGVFIPGWVESLIGVALGFAFAFNQKPRRPSNAKPKS